MLTFGAHELLTEIPQLKQALIEVKEMILLLLEKLVDLDGFIRNYLDDFHITSDVAWQSFQKEISNTIPSTIVYQALHWYESWKLLMTNVLFQRDKTQLPFEESAISIDIAKFVGLLVFLIFLFWIKSRRQRALV